MNTLSGTDVLSRFWLFCFGPLVFLLPKTFQVIWLTSLLSLSVPDEGYYTNVSCVLNLILTFSLLYLTVYKSEIREHVEYNTGSMRLYSKIFYHLIAKKCLRIDILNCLLKKNNNKHIFTCNWNCRYCKLKILASKSFSLPCRYV